MANAVAECATSVAGALRDCGLPDNEARILLGHALGAGRAWLVAHGGDALAAGQATAFGNLCARRRAGEPVAYIVGAREFYGLSFAVTPAVLIPRPETELLVDLALERLPVSHDAAHVVLDLGTGSGCVALAIAVKRPHAAITAVDQSPAALAVARTNGESLDATVTWLEGDWFSALEDRRYDLIVANPPYVAPGDPHLSVGDLRFEPAQALVAADTGLAAIRTIAAGAPRYLKPGGALLFEHGYDQAAEARAVLTKAGFGDIRSWRDLAGIERVSGGVLP